MKINSQLEGERKKSIEMEGRLATLEAEVASLAGDKLELEVFFVCL